MKLGTHVLRHQRRMREDQGIDDRMQVASLAQDSSHLNRHGMHRTCG